MRCSEAEMVGAGSRSPSLRLPVRCLLVRSRSARRIPIPTLLSMALVVRDAGAAVRSEPGCRSNAPDRSRTPLPVRRGP